MDELLFKFFCLMTLLFVVEMKEQYKTPNTVEKNCSQSSFVLKIEKSGEDWNATGDDDIITSLRMIGLKEVTKNGQWYTYTSESTGEKTKEDTKNELCERDANLCDKVKVIEVEKDCRFIMKAKVVTVNDAEWTNQWHLQTSRTPSMNVKEAWDKGFTGANILIAIVDDGVESSHSDLVDNYVPGNAYDFIYNVADGGHKDSADGHGTNCAGIAAATKNTDCVVGTAYNAKLTSVRILDSAGATASQHALAFTHDLSYIDIYSNSWGPSDDGFTFFELFGVQVEAFQTGVNHGRNGLGAIYVWASGNGGLNYDDCNADGFSKSIYTIAIGSVSDRGSFTFYSEKCAAILAATFGGADDMRIATTYVNDNCEANTFQGTSAATPMAAAIIALALEANPKLTWRDVQHLIVETADSSELHSNVTTYVNAAGKTFSQYFGFGLMNAEAMVDAASSWQTVSELITCTTLPTIVDVLSYHDPISADHTIENCQINNLEWVEIKVAYMGYYRGDIQFDLTSPQGTTSTIFSRRPYDMADLSDPTSWKFMSVHYWGENPNGKWTLTLTDVSFWEDTTMYLYSIEMIVYGTKDDDDEDNTAVIVCAVIGSVVGVVLIAGVAIFVYYKFCKVSAVAPAQPHITEQ